MEGNTDASNRYESIYFYDSGKVDIDGASPLKDDFTGSDLDIIEKRTPLPTSAQVFQFSASGDEVPLNSNRVGGMDKEKSSRLASSSKAFSKPLMISSFSSRMYAKLKEIDTNGDGMLDKGEVESMIRQLDEEKVENTNLKYFIITLVGAILLIVLSSFGLTFAAINISKETSVSEDDNGSVLRQRHSTDVIQTGVFGPDGTIRSLQTGAPMKTDAVASFTTFQELLEMPLEVIDQVSKFTFMTDDGKLRTYTKHGMELELDPPGSTVAENSTFTQAKVLTVLLSKPNSQIIIHSDGRALYTELDKNMKTVTLAVKEPGQEELSSRRRALRELAVDSNGATPFSARQRNTCTKTGACLYTRQEIMFLHSITRRLDESTGSNSAPQYVEVQGVDQLQDGIFWYDIVGNNSKTLIKTIVNTLGTMDITYDGSDNDYSSNITNELHASNASMTLLMAKDFFGAHLDRNALFMQCSSKGTGLSGAPILDTDPIKECHIFFSSNFFIQETDASYPTLTGVQRIYKSAFNRVIWTPQPSYAPTEVPTFTPTVTITAKPSLNSSIDPENGMNRRRSK